MIQLQLEDKTITLNTYDVEGKTLYKAQDLLRGYGFDYGKTKTTCQNWTRSMELKVVNFTTLKVNGKNGGTYLTKPQIFQLAGYVSYEFQMAVYEAFEQLLLGNTQEASNIAGRVAIDMELVAKADKRWKEYAKWCNVTFKSVHPQYGGNLTRLVVNKALGVSKASNVKGKTDHTLVQKLVEQNHGDAILALFATIDLAEKFLAIPTYQDLLKSHDGKKLAYKQLVEFLTFPS